MLAQLTALTAEINRDPKRRSKPFAAEDFLPRFGPPEEEPETEEPELLSWERQLRMVELWNAALGGLDLREAKD